MALSISIACWYKIARLFTTPIKSIVVIFLTLFTYYIYTESSNFAEDWNIPFITVSYFLIIYLVFNQLRTFLICGTIIGLCLAGAFFIRPNDAVEFIGAPILGLIMWLVKEKNYQAIVRLHKVPKSYVARDNIYIHDSYCVLKKSNELQVVLYQRKDN